MLIITKFFIKYIQNENNELLHEHRIITEFCAIFYMVEYFVCIEILTFYERTTIIVNNYSSFTIK